MRLRLVLLIAVSASACADDIVAPPPAEAHFTIWGSLNPDSTAQAIRVVPVLPIIDGESPDPLDATVTMTDLATGRSTSWTDSVVTYSRDRIGHVFHTTATIPHGSHQRVRVTRSDGAEVTATVHIPPAVSPVLEAPVITRAGFQDLDVTYPIFWPGAPYLEVLSVHYELLQVYECRLFSITEPGPNGATVTQTDAGWRINLSLDEAVRRGWFSNTPDRGRILFSISLEALVSGTDARPPGGTYDPALFFAPGQFSNVENGFGLVVGAYRQTISWVPDRRLTTHSGFIAKIPRDCDGYNG